MTIVKWTKPSNNEERTMNPVSLNNSLTGLFDNFFNTNSFIKEYASYVPAVNVSENENHYEMEFSAPGFEKEDFKLEVSKGTLIVSAIHKTEKEIKEKNFSRKEFNYGSFQRSFSLPEEINENGIDAKYKNGILKVFLPKKEDARSKTREIIVS